MLLKSGNHNFGAYLCSCVTATLVGTVGIYILESNIQINDVEIK